MYSLCANAFTLCTRWCVFGCDFSSRPRSTPDALDPFQDAPSIDMITTGGDKPIKFLDYISKSVTGTLEGHTSNLSLAVYQPMLPIDPEDRTVETTSLENGRRVGPVIWSFKRGRDERVYLTTPFSNLAYT